MPIERHPAWTRLVGAVAVGLSVSTVAAAQPSLERAAVRPVVRLEVEVGSWLGDTPLNLVEELKRKLEDAGLQLAVEPTEAADAVVQVEYAEVQDLRYRPGLYGTRIAFAVVARQVGDDATGGSHVDQGAVSPAPAPFDIPPLSSRNLRDDAIAAFRRREAFVFFGPWVGAALGDEASIRYLMFGPTGSWGWLTAHFLVFRLVDWRADNDDLFERAALHAKWRGATGMSDTLAQYVAQRTAPLYLDPTGRPPALGSVLAAIEALGSVGDAAAATVLEELAAGGSDVLDRRVIEAAASEAGNIRERLAR